MSLNSNVSRVGAIAPGSIFRVLMTAAVVPLIVSLLGFSSVASVLAAHNPQPGVCPAESVGGSKLNCTANDDDAQLIGREYPATCELGSTILVDVEMDFTNKTNSFRYDIAGWMSLDGKDPIFKSGSGGAASCSAGVFEPAFPEGAVNEDGDSCGDVAADSTVAPTIIGEDIPILCVPDANGNPRFLGIVTWDTNNDDNCDHTDIRADIDINKAQCSATTLSFPTEVLGTLTIIKDAGTDNTTEFDFDYTNNHQPTADTGNPPTDGDPDFDLKDDGSDEQEIDAWIGSGNPATITVTETVPSGWLLTGLDCWVTGDTGTSVGYSNITNGLSVQLTEDVPFVTCEFTNSESVAGPALTISKSSSTTSIVSPGSVPYSFLITNTGNAALTNVTLTDTFLTTFSCNGGSHPFDLAIGANETCTSSFNVDQDLIDSGDDDDDNQCAAGHLGNLATATADGPVSNTDFLCIPITNNPDIEVEKSADTEVFSDVGETINYTFDVENKGNVTLENVTVTDPHPDLENFDCDWDNSSDGSTSEGTLSPGETLECTADLTTDAGNVADGSIDNTVTAAGDSATDESEVTDTSNWSVLLSTVLSIEAIKVYNDGNPAPATVIKDCNDGHDAYQEKDVTPGNPHNFVLTDFTAGEADCTIYEEVPEGYTAWYEATGPNAVGDPNDEECRFEDVTGAPDNQCIIVNRVIPIEFDVRKIWFDEFPQFNNPMYAMGKYECWNESPVLQLCTESSEGLCPYELPFMKYGLKWQGDESWDTFLAWPHYNGETYCTVTEKIHDSSVESDAEDCFEVEVMLGVEVDPEDDEYECTIYNTRLYEGVPTLDRLSLALMSLLLLGFGMVAFRRFA
jgi:uncharacterized repeat protein (TIGR01451 family)